MTHAEFAARCANIAVLAAAWTRDTLNIPGYLDKPIGENAAARCIQDLRDRVDALEREVAA